MSPREVEEGPRSFPVTRWSRVLEGRDDPERRRATLEDLCRARWRPLYFYARRRGLAPDRAEDAVQGLLVQLLESDFMARLDPARGKLRSYLKRALVHYLTNLHEHDSAAKRGGGAPKVPLEVVEAELCAAPTDAERAFDREWALGIFESALSELEREHERGERSGPASALRQLFGFGEAPSYEELASRHGMSMSQLKSFVHRGRLRFRALVLARIADTLTSTEEADAELRDLMQALQ